MKRRKQLIRTEAEAEEDVICLVLEDDLYPLLLSADVDSFLARATGRSSRLSLGFQVD